MATKLPDIIKTNATAITSIFTVIATIGGAVVYVQNNYASAKDIQTISRNQEQQIRVQTTQQRQMSVFQLEYYDDKLRKLQEEKRVAEERMRSGSYTRAVQKTPGEIQEEINDIKQRRELVRKTLLEQQ